MANNAIDLQQQVKHNAEDFQNYLKNLYKFEEDIKVKDEALRKKTPTKSPPDYEIPIRNRLLTADVEDGGITEISSKKVEKKTSSHLNKQKALVEKNKGNDFFKDGNFEKAIKYYSAAIELDPYDAILPANRAISFLKLNRFSEAEDDCNKSLKLDPKFVKAYHRRGLARLNLGSTELARQDFEKVLSLEPHNKAAQVELEKLKNKIQSGEKVQVVKSPTVKQDILPKSKDSKKNEKKATFLQNYAVSIDEYFEPAPNVTETAPVHQIPMTIVNDEKQEQLAIEKIINEITAETSSKTFTKLRTKESKELVEELPPIPRNYFKFNQDWKKIQKHANLKYQYLKQIPPTNLPNIFRDSLETDVLADVLNVLKNEFITNGDSLVPWLIHLSQIKRIGAVVMFLSKDQKNDLEVLLKHIEEIKEGTAEERERIFQKFSF